MKIIFLAPQSSGEGEEYLSGLIAAGKQKGYEIIIAAPITGTWLFRFLRVISLLIRHHDHLVHFILPSPEIRVHWLFFARILNASRVITFQSVPRHQARKLPAWLYRHITAGNCRMITGSEKNACLIANRYHIDRRKISVIPFGVWDEILLVPGKKRQLAWESLLQNWKERGKYIIITQGYTPAVGTMDVRLAVIACLVRKYPTTQVLWIIAGAGADHLQELVIQKKLQKHILLNKVCPDITQLLPFADIFFHSGMHEPPFTILKAMLHQVLIVSQQSHDIAGIFEPGYNGLLFECGNPLDAYLKLSYAIENLTGLTAIKTRARITAAAFTVPRMTNDTFAVYDHLYKR